MDDPDQGPQRGEPRPANACFRCGTDYGSVALPRIAGLPVCDACARFLRNRPFPGWIKGAFGGLFLLAVLAFLYNQRYFFAHVEMLRGMHALKSGDLQRAVALFNVAAERVPDEPELQALSRYFQAVWLLTQDRSSQAIPLLKEALAIKPGERSFTQALRQAEAGEAYEQKDYDRFLEVQQRLATEQPEDPIAALGVASAHACRYAVTGDETLKALAEQQIETASKMKGALGPAFAEYVDRIRYRLETREIISRDEYRRRFPNGRGPGAPGTAAHGTGGGG